MFFHETQPHGIATHGSSLSSWLVAPVDQCQQLLPHTTASKRDGERRFASTYYTSNRLYRSYARAGTDVWSCFVGINILPYVFKHSLILIPICMTQSGWVNKNALFYDSALHNLALSNTISLLSDCWDWERRKGGLPASSERSRHKKRQGRWPLKQSVQKFGFQIRKSQIQIVSHDGHMDRI